MMTNKYLTLIAGLCLSVQIASADYTDSIAVAARQDTSVVERQYLDVIEHCDSIRWLLLDPMSEDSLFCLQGLGEPLDIVKDTVAERKDACIATLSYSKSFVKSDMVKECTFLPDIAIFFYSKGQRVDFAYSFYCDLCRFIRGDKYQELDGELVRKTILQMACEVFPRDRYLRLLKRKE